MPCYSKSKRSQIHAWATTERCPPGTGRAERLLPLQPSPTSHPVGGAIRPGGDIFFRAAQTVAVATGRINVELDRYFHIFQGQCVKQRALHSHGIVLRHGDEGRRCVCCNGNLWRHFVAFLFFCQATGVNQYLKIRPATHLVRIIQRRVAALLRVAAQRGRQMAPAEKPSTPTRCGSIPHSFACCRTNPIARCASCNGRCASPILPASAPDTSTTCP